MIKLLSKRCCCRVHIILDVVVILSLGIILAVLMLCIAPVKRGFFCDDVTIHYPFHTDTITEPMLLLYGFGLPFIIMLIVEALTLGKDRSNNNSSISGCHLEQNLHSKSHENSTATTSVLPSSVSQSSTPNLSSLGHTGTSSRSRTLRRYCYAYAGSVAALYGVYLFGMTTTLTVTEIGKLSIGRLRPHFMDLCRPDVALHNNCTPGLYITEYRCTNDISPDVSYIDRQKEVRKSFPSGHASMSIFTAVFLAFYLGSRLPPVIGSYKQLLLTPFLQAVLISSALFISLTRITDNMHHPDDVIVGAAIGATIAFLLTLRLRQSGRARLSNGSDVTTSTDHLASDCETNSTNHVV